MNYFGRAVSLPPLLEAVGKGGGWELLSLVNTELEFLNPLPSENDFSKHLQQ